MERTRYTEVSTLPGSTKTRPKRVKAKCDPHPERPIADTAYGTGPLLGWPVDREIAPRIPVFDKSGRNDGTWSRADFEWDAKNDRYICPEGRALKQFRRDYSDPNRGPTGKGTARYRAVKGRSQKTPIRPPRPRNRSRPTSHRSPRSGPWSDP